MNKNSKTAKQLLILFLVKAGLTKLNPSSKVVRGRRVISMMTGNPNYVTPSLHWQTLPTKPMHSKTQRQLWMAAK